CAAGSTVFWSVAKDVRVTVSRLEACCTSDATRVRLASEVQQASSRLTVTRTSLATLQNTVLPAAQSAYEAATKGFEAGKFGFIDVLDAQRALLAARSRYLNTLAAAYQAATAIDRIVGQ
ncbi:MAG: TolC family protein, partial [Comamonadaceae bacterium]